MTMTLPLALRLIVIVTSSGGSISERKGMLLSSSGFNAYTVKPTARIRIMLYTTKVDLLSLIFDHVKINGN